MIYLERRQRRNYSLRKADIVTHYELEDRRLLRKTNEGEYEEYLYVIPKSVRKNIVVKYHDMLDHFGVDRSVRKIKERFSFPKMKRYVRRYIAACDECLLSELPGVKTPEKFNPPEPPKRPFEKVHMDHVGPFIISEKGNKYVLVTIDALTKFVRIYPVESTSTLENLRSFQGHINNYGTPKRLAPDRGSRFTLEDWKVFFESLNMKQTLTSTRWVQANR